jgi:hypothetical protein
MTAIVVVITLVSIISTFWDAELTMLSAPQASSSLVHESISTHPEPVSTHHRSKESTALTIKKSASDGQVSLYSCNVTGIAASNLYCIFKNLLMRALP